MSEVLVTSEDGVLRLTLNRPEALNALNNAMLATLLDAVRAAAADASVRAIVFAGEGEKAFCAGIDLAQRQALSFDDRGAQSRRLLDLIRTVRSSPKPSIVAMHGWCLGAGLELATGCDIRVAADDARFGFPELMLGAYPGGGGAVLLPRIIGRAKAVEWLLSNRRIDSAEALAMGLVGRVVPRAELVSSSIDAARRIAAMAPLAVAAMKQSIDAGLDVGLDKAFDTDQMLRRPLDGTADYEEGLLAHKEKRTPVFTGR